MSFIETDRVDAIYVCFRSCSLLDGRFDSMGFEGEIWIGWSSTGGGGERWWGSVCLRMVISFRSNCGGKVDEITNHHSPIIFLISEWISIITQKTSSFQFYQHQSPLCPHPPISSCISHSPKPQAQKRKGRTHWIATLPSTLPIAYPFPPGKQVISLVCIFKEDSFIYCIERRVDDGYQLDFHYANGQTSRRIGTKPFLSFYSSAQTIKQPNTKKLTFITTPGFALKSTTPICLSAVPNTCIVRAEKCIRFF